MQEKTTDGYKHLVQTEELVLLGKHMYDKGESPDDFSKSIVVPIEKKAECGDFRTIKKIVLKILTKRITTKTEEFLGKNQFGFRKRLWYKRSNRCYENALRKKLGT